MTGLRIGRLLLGPPSGAVVEPLGDPIAGVGGAAVPAPRVPQQISLQLNTIVTSATTLAQAQTVRRQLRSLLNNSQLKLQGHLYIAYDDDPEFNGWYVPDVATMSSRDPTSFKAGVWETDQMNFTIAGHLRTHRPGRQVWMKDLTTGQYPRDTIGAMYSVDFATYKANWIAAGQPAPQLVALPPGSAGIVQAVVNQTFASSPLPAGRDGSQSVQLAGVSDLIALVYDWTEANLNQGDVIVYDRRGQITAPAAGPDTLWEEVYGPDYPWNWLTGGQPNDTPVLDNGLVRVRYDASVGQPGFRVDVWTGSAYVEQGKVVFYRVGDSSSFDDTWVSASLREYTPDRAVLSVVLSSSADARSREQIFVTLQRGQLGAVFESYPAVTAAGALADAKIVWALPLGDANDSAAKSDSNLSPLAASSGVIDATAGSGSTSLGAAATLGASTFVGENFVVVLRCPTTFNVVGSYQSVLVVVQAALGVQTAGSGTFASGGYGSAGNAVVVGRLTGSALGYAQAQLALVPTVSDQINEAESIRNVSGTTSQVADANASNALAVKDTQAANTNATLTKATNLLQAKYRIFARVRSDGGAASFQARLGATVGGTVTFSLATYDWVDLGDILAPAANPTLTVRAWGGTLAAPTGLSVSVIAGTGTWSGTGTAFWKVTAHNAQGETLGSTEVSAPIGAGNLSTVKIAQLTWNAVPGATTYTVYRALATGGEGTSPALVATVSAPTTTYNDTGTATTAGNVPASNTAVFNAYIDRYEAYLIEDRARSGNIYIGARDQAQAALFDARVLGLLSTR